MMKRKDKRWRVDLAIVALSFVIGAAAFSMHRAQACDKRGGRDRTEEFELEVVASEIDGEPRIAMKVEVADNERLYKNSRKGTRINLFLAGLAFEKVSE